MTPNTRAIITVIHEVLNKRLKINKKTIKTIEPITGLISILQPDLIFSSFFVSIAKITKLLYLTIAVAKATAIKPNSSEMDNPIFKNR